MRSHYLLAPLRAALVLCASVQALSIPTSSDFGSKLERKSIDEVQFTSEQLSRRQAAYVSPPSYDTEFAYYTATDGSKIVEYRSRADGAFSGNVNNNSPTINFDLNAVRQPFDGVGVTLTDASCINLQKMKAANPNAYWSWLGVAFNRLTGMNVLRITIGATDFSNVTYTLADQPPNFLAPPTTNPIGAMDQSFSPRVINDFQLQTVQDILKVRPSIKVMLTPWSAPAWMKVNEAGNLNGFNGGYLKSGYEAVYAEYIARATKAWRDNGIRTSFITVGNEQLFIGSYPSMSIDAPTEAKVASTLKTRLAAMGIGGVRILSMDHNWDLWQEAMKRIKLDTSAFDGVAFHNYGGTVSQQTDFKKGLDAAGLASKAIHFTEATGKFSNITSPVDALGYWAQLYADVANNWARTAMSWNFVLDSSFGPRLPQAYCSDCIGLLSFDQRSQLTATPILYANQHFAAINTDLTGLVSGGLPAFRIGTSSTGTNGCISTITAFAAAMGGGKKRVGGMFFNSCNVQVAIKLKTAKAQRNCESPRSPLDSERVRVQSC